MLSCCTKDCVHVHENVKKTNDEVAKNDIDKSTKDICKLKLDDKSSSISDDIDDYKETTLLKTRRNSIFTKTFNPENNISIDNETDCNPSLIQNLNNDYNFSKSSEIKLKLKNILKSIVIFKHLYDDELNEIIDNMFQKQCSINEIIIREGDDGNYFYVIENGLYEIYKKSPSNKQTQTYLSISNDQSDFNCYGSKVGEYKGNGFFGELALLYNQPRSATIISMEDGGILWAMNRQTFQRLVITSAFKRRKLYEDFLKSVPLLQDSMSDFERSQVADALTSYTFKKSDCIIRDGDVPNGMYFIEEGEVLIHKESNDSNSFEVILKKGDYFGELALINKTQRSASAFAHSDPCKVAFLDLEAFERLMGPCIELIRRNIRNYRAV